MPPSTKGELTGYDLLSQCTGLLGLSPQEARQGAPTYQEESKAFQLLYVIEAKRAAQPSNLRLAFYTTCFCSMAVRENRPMRSSA